MSAVTKIRRLLAPEMLAKRLISASLSVIPSNGVQEAGLRRLESQLPRALSMQHRALLSTWNGLNLDVIRIFGVEPVADRIPELIENQTLVPEGSGNIAFGSDPSGFLYFEDAAGSVLSFDHDGGEVKLVASCIDEFIDDIVFGPRADSFMGEDWLIELRGAGLA